MKYYIDPITKIQKSIKADEYTSLAAERIVTRTMTSDGKVVVGGNFNTVSMTEAARATGGVISVAVEVQNQKNMIVKAIDDKIKNGQPLTNKETRILNLH